MDCQLNAQIIQCQSILRGRVTKELDVVDNMVGSWKLSVYNKPNDTSEQVGEEKDDSAHLIYNFEPCKNSECENTYF